MQHVDYRTLLFSEREYCMEHTANTSLTRVKLANLQFLHSNRKLQSFKPLEQKQKQAHGKTMPYPTDQAMLAIQSVYSPVLELTH